MINRRNFIKITAVGSVLTTLGQMTTVKAAMRNVVPNDNFCLEGAHTIPVIKDCDIVVVGGSSRAVAAAVAAQQNGATVFLVAELPYLGDDICGSFLYQMEKEDESSDSDLSRKLFYSETNKVSTPLEIKMTLENELIDNHVDFLYSCYATNMLVDTDGKVSGVVIANRSGRQAIRCKAVIDATHEAVLASMMEIPFYGEESEPIKYQYTVVGGEPQQHETIRESEILPYRMESRGQHYPVIRYTFERPVGDILYASLATMEQQARDVTWTPDQVDSSDILWYIPSTQIKSKRKYTDRYRSVQDITIDSFVPNMVDNLWILGPCADLPRTVAERVMRPSNAILLGKVIGESAARYAAQIHSVPQDAEVKTIEKNATDYGTVRELLSPLRTDRLKGSVVSSNQALPILGRYDVVVIGGGTAGAPAGIAAARHGVKTLVLDYLHGLGGTSTLGMIGRYWDGYREGFSAVIDKGVKEMAPANHPLQLKQWTEEFRAEWKKEWYRRELRKAGADIWFGVLGCGAIVEKKSIQGVVVATPLGRGVVLADKVIDSTGSADIAIAAGSGFEYTGKKTLAVQGAGMSQKDLTDFYNNTDWSFIDDTDILDVSRVFIQAKQIFRGHYDVIKMPQTRERRRIVGDYEVSVYDVLNHRRYEDTISYHKSSFDTHGMVVDPYFILTPPLERHTIYDADVPLRSFLPKGLEQIAVTGLGTSAHRDAMPIIRMQSCLQNQGYSVGCLAAFCVKEKNSFRKMDIKKVQKLLVKIGNLPERVLTDRNFGGYSKKEMEQAVISLPKDYKGLEILLTDKPQCIKLLNQKMKTPLSLEQKVAYASVLCFLGEKKYASVLAEKIHAIKEWDKGWHYTGMGQFGMSNSYLDALMMALGHAKDKTFVSVVKEKARLLHPENTFSHYRAVTTASEYLESKEMVPELVALLNKVKQQNQISDYAEARGRIVSDASDTSVRNAALKELLLARALYYCGDSADRMGETILRRYAKALEGHYARFASESLIK